MRVYVPTTVAGLVALRENGFLPPMPAHAVTAALRAWHADGTAEELEHAASEEAARACLDLLALVPQVAVRRVVVAADVSPEQVRTGGPVRSSVGLLVPVPLELVVSLHVDDDEAVADVALAVRALPAAVAGDELARLRVADAAANALLWYDVRELDDVLGTVLEDVLEDVLGQRPGPPEA